MNLSDPIADFLTRIRNAATAKHKRTSAPSSNMNLAIAAILKEQGYIADFERIDKTPQDELVVSMRYSEGQPAFTEIKRVSRPGIRRYASVKELPRVRNGLGIAVVSTPRGVVTDKEARRLNVGGEVICTVW